MPTTPPSHLTVLRATLLMAVAAIAACASTPEPAPQPSAPVEAPAPATEAGMSEAMQNQMAELRQELTEAGITVTDAQGGRIKLNIPSDLSFGSGQTAIKPSFGKVLDLFAGILNKYPNTLIDVVGHTDSSGKDDLNLKISLQRAENTRDYLVEHGVAADRFITHGWGSDSPITDNKTAKGRAMNRRVEVFVSER